MSVFVFDSDGLIKLQKAGVLDMLAESHECLVPGKVYGESVERGKSELYEDAFELGETIEEHMRVVEAEDPESEKTPAKESLGSGELSAYGVHLQEGSDALISDDRAFLNFLESKGIPFITPANVIVEMKNQGQIPRDRAVEALGRMEKYIRNEVYEKSIEEVRK
ncbi:hypothetical protein AKJ51_04065 [candidate division MSBL1 archaeon SCGC-AAA382A20]|uniref:PIN domain-containing protein n=1 Tax=candidate division MSBL1 archaeon SCGC-AAA382A20 TaxID=1698280 RepID=A0A133VID9_9EURY|nr:hypothetical protein AKJ51_04065 [candidate division MSBL1 archaeon SCGC-AAA382A20]